MDGRNKARTKQPGIRVTAAAHLRIVFVAACAMLGGASVARVWAQTSAAPAGVKRVAFEWAKTDKQSSAVGERVLQKLRASKSVEIVTSSEQADELLRGDATIWVAGREASSPRSKGAERTIYKGFASIEVHGKNGQVLWSYLATPRPVGWTGITDDLGDQLAHEFLARSKADVPVRSAETNSSTADRGTAVGVALHGAGSTFSAPMYLKWFESYTHSRPAIHIQYDALGSGEGIERVLAGQMDFGATDMPLPPEQLNQPTKQLLQVATMVGAVVSVYNVKGISADLNMSPGVLAGIYLGKIRRWNAPEIGAINKGARLPDQEITVIHRAESSGTTFAWTDYLSKVSTEWKNDVGSGMLVKWPVGTAATGNAGVALAVQRTPNSIGYIEMLYALQYELPFAAVRNASGDFVKADVDSVTAAAKIAEGADHNRMASSITNANGKHVYPIATLTWLLVPLGERDTVKTSAMRDLLQWILTSGQRQCEGLGYAPLPSELAKRELKRIASLQ
jgi:phosphate transport system substrate-binding protein